MFLVRHNFLAVSRTLILLGVQASALAGLLPRLNLAPRPFTFSLELVIARTEFSNGLLGQELLQRPLLNVLGLVLLELSDELNGALQD